MCFKKINAIAIILSLILVMFSACESNAPESANEIFESTKDSLIDSILTDSPLDLHFCLADTIEYDALTSEKVLSAETGNDSDILNQTHETLHTIATSELSDDNRYQYKILLNYIENQQALSAYDYKYEPLSAFSGEQVQLPLLMAEFPFRGSSDVDIYMKLLSDIPNYFQSIIEYETQKKADDEFMSENCYNTVVSFCLDFPTDDPADHFLAHSFSDKMENLSIDEEIKETYIKEHLEILETVVFPAYTKLSSDLKALGSDAVFHNEGLCDTSSGREYYNALIKSQTGDTRDVESIGNELEVNLATYSQLLNSSIKANADLWSNIISGDLYKIVETNKVQSSANEYLDILYNLSKDSFGYSKTKNYSVRFIEPKLSPYFSSAFFLLPPVDDFSNPTIYINPENQFTGFDLFTTLAHEGFPGHLAQTLTQKDDLFTRLFSCLGYCEGWATYCELYSYPTAVRTLNICDEEQVENISYILKLYREVTLCVYALLDYNIHYNYWTVDDAASLLSDYGISDEETICQIYNYIVNEPANYMTYYVGYMNVVNLKEEYIGMGHSEEEFHEAFLECGEAPFEIVKTKLLH